MNRRWKPAPAIKASIAAHLAAGLGTLALPQIWPWALGLMALNQIALGGAGMLPRSTLLGPNITRLPATAVTRREIVLTIDDGPDPAVTPRVLDRLDQFDVKASFFCIGRAARQHPALCREIVSRGHSVENHGDSHSWGFATFGLKRIRQDISAAQATLADITGQAPRFFRPTAGLRSPLLDPVLAELDLRLAAWTRRPYDTQDGNSDHIFQRLNRNLDAGDILLMHDGNAALTPAGEPVIVAVLPRLLQAIQDARLNPVTLPAALT